MQSELLNYLAKAAARPGQRLPPIDNLAVELGISTSKLREQLQVARELGFVEVRPKIGTRRLAYSLLPSLLTSLRFALESDPTIFESLGVIRNHLEASFWHDAVCLLTEDDKRALKQLVDRAWSQLRSTPVQIPHAEHRDLHLMIYSRLENPILHALLETYWQLNETIGYQRYSDYDYLSKAWEYHERMVDAITTGDHEAGYQALIEHSGLLQDCAEMDNYRPEFDGQQTEIDSFAGQMGVTPYE